MKEDEKQDEFPLERQVTAEYFLIKEKIYKILAIPLHGTQ